MSTSLSAQSVSGVITDASGPLPGANVIVKGTANGTTTDFDGKYLLENLSSDATIVVSFLGYATQEVLVSGRNEIDIVLTEDTSQLDEVVVVGYSSKSTRDITGSVEVVDVENLQKAAPLSVEQALQGQASGVSVGVAGTPGGSAAVRIRGFSSLNGADPLYVIDGTPTGSGISDLNPSDIESIQVLKDASSTAIYGNRAANGVIIVTTKKGKRNNKTTFKVNSWTGVDYIPRSVFPDLASPTQIADALWQAQLNTDGTTPITDLYGSGGSPVLPNFIIPIGAETADLSTYGNTLENNNPISLANKEGTDWFGEFFNAAIVHKTDVSMSGGNEKSNYYVSFSVLDQDGVGLESSYDRYTTRVNSDFSATSRFRVGQSLNLSYSEQVEFRTNDDDDASLDNAIISLLRIHPIIPVYDVNGNFSGSFGSDLTGNGLNPIATAINGRDNKGITFRAIGNFYAEYDLLKDLTVKSNLGYNFLSFERRTFNPSRNFDSTPNFSNSLKEEVANTYDFNWFNTLTYDTTFGDNHDLTVLAGSELVRTRRKFFDIFTSNFEFEDELDTQFVELAGSIDDVTGRASKTALFSLLGKLSYKYADKYLIDGTVRRDSSSRFGAFDSDLRTQTFFSFSGGWRVSNESFLRDSDVVTNLLFKGGYGEIGNDGIPEALDQITFANDSQFDSSFLGGSDTQGTSVFSLGNELVQWETKKSISAGFDLTLFNKLDIGFEYFDATTEDLLTQVDIDPTINGERNTIAANVGELSNTGFDINLGYSDQTSSGFSYGISLNVSHYKNEIELLNPNNPVAQILGTDFAFHGPANVTQEGSPIGSFFGFEYVGVDESTGEGLFLAADGTTTSTPDVNEDRRIIGDPHPDFTYGINFNAGYKNFDFSMFFQGSQGNDIYNLTRFITVTSQFSSAKSIDFINAATPGNSGNIPLSRTDVDQLSGAGASSFFIEDGSYIKLKSIQLGYTIPSDFTKSLNIESFRVYLQAKNLFTITDYSGLDPEISVRNFNNAQTGDDIRSNNTRSLGVDSGSYPIPRSIIMGLNITL